MKCRFTLMGVLTLLLHIHSSFACGNEYSYLPSEMPRKNGKPDLNRLLYPKGEVKPYWSIGFSDNVREKYMTLLSELGKKAGVYPESLESKYSSIVATLIKKDEYQLLSDFAWYDLRVNDRKRALALLEQLYQLHPKEYNIVANLGTAYEVNGNNAKALEMIRKAVELNAASHNQSEWIHVRILEQKMSSPPDYKKIIDLGIQDFGKWMADRKDNFPQNPDSLKVQIAYQLHERIAFIPPPDPVVAQLVLDFADIVAKHDGSNEAMPFYEFAANYGGSDIVKIVTDRKKSLTQTREEIEGTFRKAAIVWAVPLLALVVIFFAWLRSIRNRKRA